MKKSYFSKQKSCLSALCIFATTLVAVIGVLSSQAFAQTTVYEESFSSGLGSFSGSGRVYTGSYGVRLRGGTTSAIVSSSISLDGYTDISLAYDRAASGLDSGLG